MFKAEWESTPADENQRGQVAWQLIIRENDKTIADATLIDQGKQQYLLARMDVREEFHGQGFDDLAIRLMLDKALSLGAMKLSATPNADDKELYTKFGFRQKGNNSTPPGKADAVDLYADADDIVFPSECQE